MNKDYTSDITAYFDRLKQTIDKISKDDLNNLMNLLEKARMEGRSIFIMGNGGSASTASHYVCDFNKGISENQDIKYRFICLNDNIATMMAYANDISYHDIFINPLKNHFKPGDLVIGISGSGNSQNVVKALKYANENEGISIGLTGFDGGEVHRISKYGINIPVNDMQLAEDLHLVLDHCMMKILSPSCK